MAKKKKHCNRERSVTIGFRMTEDAARRLDALVSISGLSKQDYIECRLTNQSVTVVPSSRVARSLSCWMQSIYRELLIAREEGRMLDADLIWITRTVSEEYAAMAATEISKDANEAIRDIERYR